VEEEATQPTFITSVIRSDLRLGRRVGINRNKARANGLPTKKKTQRCKRSSEQRYGQKRFIHRMGDMKRASDHFFCSACGSSFFSSSAFFAFFLAVAGHLGLLPSIA
jgi:hypothetical protein